jgi:Rrf2 family protein
MRISATEEYGLRILMRIAKAGEDGMNIPQLSSSEGLSEPYVGKLTRMLRLSGFISSTRGQKGGYILLQSPDEIRIASVLQALDGRLFDDDFCASHTGMVNICTHSVDCSVKSLWKRVQASVDTLLEEVTLADMINNIKEEQGQEQIQTQEQEQTQPQEQEQTQPQ